MSVVGLVLVEFNELNFLLFAYNVIWELFQQKNDVHNGKQSVKIKFKRLGPTNWIVNSSYSDDDQFKRQFQTHLKVRFPLE